ncbi:MAG: type IVB secretion system protein IcmH/DotU, partial [Pseudomonadota bacterium]|nr:type IVB secretion system protein IcmH/DotU [Pseudomonadota bacterium]
LVEAATRLLILMTGLKNTLEQPDPARLRRQVIDEVKAFAEQLGHLNVSQDTAQTASYVLCTAIDDIVLNNTRWGGTSLWREQSLLVTLHRDVRGGEVFFELLKERLRNPAASRALLELMYVCLALGFQGVYRGRPEALAAVRDQLHEVLAAIPPQPEPELSPRPHTAAAGRAALGHFLPLWVVPALAGALLLLLYAGLLLALNDRAYPVRARLEDIAVAKVQPVAWQPAQPPPAAAPGLVERMRGYLAAPIREKRLEVLAAEDGATVRILGQDLFRSGSAGISDNAKNYPALMGQIAAALNRETGAIRVEGHTDNVPTRTLRYPSNWELSTDRAHTVFDLLVQSGVAAERVTVKGLADSRPLPGVDPDSREGRDRNRRVEITILGD